MGLGLGLKFGSLFGNIGKKLGNLYTSISTKLPAEAFRTGLERLAELPSALKQFDFRGLKEAGGQVIKGIPGYPDWTMKGTTFGKIPRDWSYPTMGGYDAGVQKVFSLPEALFSGGGFYG